MRTQMLLLIVIGVCACIVAGCAVAETVMYPNDGMENITFNDTNETVTMNGTNSTNTNATVSVLKYGEPKGFLHKIVRKFHNPIDDAPFIAPGIKKYHNALWIKNSNNIWVQIAKLDTGGRIVYLFINNPQIINIIIPHCPMAPHMITVPVIPCYIVNGNVGLIDNTIINNNGDIINTTNINYTDAIVNNTTITDINNTTTTDTSTETNESIDANDTVNDTMDTNITDTSNDTVVEDTNDLNDTNDTVVEDSRDDNSNNLESYDSSSYDDFSSSSYDDSDYNDYY